MALIKIEIYDNSAHSLGPSKVKCFSAQNPVEALVEHCRVSEEVIQELDDGVYTAETPKADFYAQAVN